MANSRKTKSDDDRRRCKKHPKHRQSPGVCSLCLSEKLSHLSSSRKPLTSLASPSSSSSLSSYYSSASSCSSCSSPMKLKSSVFKKSRSLAFAPRTRGDGNGKNNGGFWSKLLGRSRRKQKGALTHSRTMIQRVHG